MDPDTKPDAPAALRYQLGKETYEAFERAFNDGSSGRFNPFENLPERHKKAWQAAGEHARGSAVGDRTS